MAGTGKEVLSGAIVKYSKRYDKPFVKVNCAAISQELLESECFGYEEGAFTGAKRGGEKGVFEQAEGGTILLDEIEELPFTGRPCFCWHSNPGALWRKEITDFIKRNINNLIEKCIFDRNKLKND